MQHTRTRLVKIRPPWLLNVDKGVQRIPTIPATKPLSNLAKKLFLMPAIICSDLSRSALLSHESTTVVPFHISAFSEALTIMAIIDRMHLQIRCGHP